MKLKKIVSLFIVLSLMLTSAAAFGAFNDVNSEAPYAEAVERIAALGIIKGMGDGNFSPDGYITREQFATLIVKAAGLEETAKTLSGTTIFPDIDPYGWSAGYVNAALNKGYVTGMADGKFHPEESVTFAQACTILVRALGYTDQDITGLWPKNYIEKAKTLGLTPGIALSGSDSLPRWAAAVMIDKLLVTNMKTTGQTAAKSFADASGLYTECIVLANPSTSSKLAKNQILTSTGTYYVGNADIKLDIGSKYKLVIKNDAVVNAYNVVNPMLKVSVDNAVENIITYRNSGEAETMTLPDKTVYYYQGAKQSYDNLKNILQSRTSIIFAYNNDKTGFEYAVIVDPVYSKPQIVSGSIYDENLPWGLPVARNGEMIGMSQIQDKDVVYQVTDIWGNNKYILVVNNSIKGEITGILPNKLSPKSVEIEGKSYNLGSDVNVNKINGTPGSFVVGDSVTLLTGYDGKIIDIIYADSEDNNNYAFVVNYGYTTSASLQDYGKTVYTVKLMMTDGSTVTYKANTDPSALKGRLVTYNLTDEDSVALTLVGYGESAEMNFNIDGKKIDNNYVTGSVKIFNLVANGQGVDAQVELLNWSDLPYGKVPSGKVQLLNKIGPFEDINLIVTSDIFDKNDKAGVIKKITSGKNGTTYTILVDGKDYSYTGTYLADITVGNVVTAKMSNNSISSIWVRNPAAQTTVIQAMDSNRIKLNGVIYDLKDNAVIYLKDYMGNLTQKGINDITAGKTYSSISAYTDKDLIFNGKVDVIIITDY